MIALKILIINCLLLTFVKIGDSALFMTKGDEECKRIPEDVLAEVLGSSFNPRYMSINPPVVPDQLGNGLKRASTYELDFYVDDEHFEEVDSEPAWVVKNFVKVEDTKHIPKRFKRSVSRGGRRRPNLYNQFGIPEETHYENLEGTMENNRESWECESAVVWKDLGPDYFPRFIREVECKQKKCWYRMYTCQPRSFIIRVLRKKKNMCVLAEPGQIIGWNGNARDVRELWVWEDRALNFCCDCTQTKKL